MPGVRVGKAVGQESKPVPGLGDIRIRDFQKLAQPTDAARRRTQNRIEDEDGDIDANQNNDDRLAAREGFKGKPLRFILVVLAIVYSHLLLPEPTSNTLGM